MNNYPTGSWIKSSRNYKIENGYLICECKNIKGKYIKNKVKIKENDSFSNINGILKLNENTLNIFTLGGKNFGDAVNKTFWEKLTNKKIKYNKKKIHYVTTGSIMCLIKNKSIIFGTGLISEDGDIGGSNFKSKKNILYSRPNKIIAVRGPLTRKVLLKHNINCPSVYGDPLILMPCIYNVQTNISENIVGIIPHYVDKKNKNVKILENNLKKNEYIVHIIDIEIGDNYKKFINNVNKCKYIISSSLHGVIMGIIYKKNTIFIEFSKLVIGNKFKFNDFFKSIKINYTAKNIYKLEILNNCIKLDYKNLINIGNILINKCPFVNKIKKEKLLLKYNNFYLESNN